MLSIFLGFAAISQTTCGAPTTKNTPCKMRVKEAGEKCFNHSETSKVCGAATSNGGKCTRKVKQGLCWQHDPNKKAAKK